MPEFRSWADLEAHIKKKVDESLKDEVAEKIKIVEMGAIQDVVYGAYGNNETGEPNMYERRMANGGLGDPDNMVAHVSNGTLYIENFASFNENYGGSNSGVGLAELVEYGNGHGGTYDYYKGKNTYGHFAQARPFTQETINRVRADDIHVKALKAALRARGLNVK